MAVVPLEGAHLPYKHPTKQEASTEHDGTLGARPGLTTRDIAVGSDDVYREPVESVCSYDEDDGWNETFIPPDRGYSWVVCFTSFWTNAIIFGSINAFGIFYMHIVRTYAKDDTPMAFKTAWIGSVQVAATFMFAPLASIVEDVVGLQGTAIIGSVIATTAMFLSSYVSTVELLIVTYGLLVGIGYSLIYTPSTVILGHYFECHLGLANGIVQAGSSLAVISLPFTLEGLIEEIGVQNTFKLLSGFIALLGPCALAWKPIYKHPEYHWRQLSGWQKVVHVYMDAHIWRHRSYPRWVLALSFAFLGYMVPFVHIMKHATETIPQCNVIVLILCLGSASGVSRLLSGEVADLPRMSRIVMQQVALFLLGVVTICIPQVTSFSSLLCLLIVLGVCDGCVVSLIMPIVYDLLGPHGAPQGIGTQMGLCALPMVTGPPLAALMYEYKGNYHLAFTLAGVPPIIGAIIMIFVPRKDHVHIRKRLAPEPEPEVVLSSLNNVSTDYHSQLSVLDRVSAGDEGAITKGQSKKVTLTNILGPSNKVEPGPPPVHS